ncbi:MAG: outer membrane protein assembly factor BamD [Candidatus Eisenbacteria bacterium]|nr:outer membrane protein assembly factor BamD [Candidatus Eisenbacteria bacterium]
MRKLATFFMVVLIAGCAATEAPLLRDPAARLEVAREAYDQKKYDSAIELLKQFVSDFPGTSLTGEAIYYLGSSYLKTKEYALGVAEFERLVQDFPKGEFTAQAEYELGLCYFGQSRPAPFDQEMTLRALAQFEHAESEYEGTPAALEAQKMAEVCRSRLAEKEYRAGLVYLKLGHPEVARKYFENTIVSFSDTEWALLAMYEEGISFEKQGLWNEAIAAYNKVKDDNPDSHLGRKADQRILAVEKKLKEGKPGEALNK